MKRVPSPTAGDPMSASEVQPEEIPIEYDPTFLHSRKEALIIVAAWAVCMAWTVPYCYLNGYNLDPDAAASEAILGVPRWAFWGILIPWIAASVFGIAFSMLWMKEDDLGEDNPEPGAEKEQEASSDA
ncbi:MAG: DUF997 family protein [Planctomycetales bacterium]